MTISYSCAKALKSFLGGRVVLPIQGQVWHIAKCDGKPHPCFIQDVPMNGEFLSAYTLEDLLSKPFCEAMATKMIEIADQWPWRKEKFCEVGEHLFNSYYDGGLPAVEKCLMELMEAK